MTLQAADATMEPRTEAERRLAHPATWGEVLDGAAFAEAERVVRGALLRTVLLAQCAAGPARGLGLRARGIVVDGPIDLAGLGRDGAALPPLELVAATAVSEEGIWVDIAGARIAALSLHSSALALIRATGAAVASSLSLAEARCTCRAPGSPAPERFAFEGLRVDGDLDLSGLAGWPHTPDPYLELDRASIRGSLILSGARLERIDLFGATVLGDLMAPGAVLSTREDGVCLAGDRMRCGGNVVLNGARCVGTVRLTGARIDGQLNGVPAPAQMKPDQPDRRLLPLLLFARETALACDGATIAGGAFLNGLQAEGRISFSGARLASLSLGPAECDHPGEPRRMIRRAMVKGLPRALSLDGATVEGEVRLSGAQMEGEVSMIAARIGGLSATTATVSSADGSEVQAAALFIGPADSLSLDRAVVSGSVFLYGARFDGTLRLPGARISGQLNANDGVLIQPPQPAGADGRGEGNAAGARPFAAVFAANARFEDGITFAMSRVLGRVDLEGATVAGDLSFAAARLGAEDGAGGLALVGSGLTVRGDLLFGLPAQGRDSATVAATDDPREQGGADVRGEVRLNRAEIGGAVVLNQARFRAAGDPERDPGPVLTLEQARIRDRIEVRRLHPDTFGTIDLRGAATDLLDDEGGRGWGQPCTADQPPADTAHTGGALLLLSGLAYVRLPELEARRGAGDGGRNAASVRRRSDRLAFLMRQFPGARPQPRDFNPQPFEQLVRVLRGAGHPEDADWFAREKRRFRTRCRVDGWLSRSWQQFLGVAFGHFYSPARALGTALVALAVGVALVLAANAAGALVAKRSDVALSPATLARLNPSAAPPAEEPRTPCWEAAPARTMQPAVLADVAVFALDLLVPVFNLKLERRCEIHAAPTERGLWTAAFVLYSIAGLVLVPLFVATVSGLARRD